MEGKARASLARLWPVQPQGGEGAEACAAAAQGVWEQSRHVICTENAGKHLQWCEGSWRVAWAARARKHEQQLQSSSEGGMRPVDGSCAFAGDAEAACSHTSILFTHIHSPPDSQLISR